MIDGPNVEEIARLKAQALRLEDEAVVLVERDLNHADAPRRTQSRIAHARLKLEVATMLRARAGRLWYGGE